MPEVAVNQVGNMDELHFQEALKGLTAKEQEILEQIFARWMTCNDWEGHRYYGKCDHGRLLENIRKEHYLRLSRFSSILKHFVNYEKESMVKMLAIIQSIIQLSFRLEGEPLGEQPTVFATAILREDLENYLEEQEFSIEEIKEFYAKEPDDYNDKEQNAFIKITTDLVWLTWDENKVDDPYQFLMDLNTDNIRHSMALSERYEGRQMVLFYFKFKTVSDEKTQLHRPTWCDANFFDKFKGTDRNQEKRWGLTFPTKDVQLSSPNHSPRRPEGVILSGNLICKHAFKRTKTLN